MTDKKSIRLTRKSLKKEIELWVEIPGTNGNYQVSSRNRVKSMSRRVKFFKGKTRLTENKILMPQYNPVKNSTYCNLQIKGKQTTFIIRSADNKYNAFINIIKQYNNILN